jgi:phosphoenolpyruvate synthase/pyruvate phosphate dikinase
MRKVILIFTRDFNLWTNEMVREMYLTEIPRIWGKGLNDQIIHFNGRAAEWIRYEDEFLALTDYIAERDLNHRIFKKESYEQYNKDSDDFRKLIEVNIDEIKNPLEHYKNIKESFKKVYPFYTLCVFIPGKWREAIIKNHGQKAEKIFDFIMASREKTEGLFKENDLFMREWLGGLIEKQGYPKDYFKLLTVKEAENFVNNNQLPKKEGLDERNRGFVFIDGIVHPTTDYINFFRKLNITYLEPKPKENQAELKGTVACQGGIFEGRVQTLLNSNEVSKFEKDRILVTPMTSPEFLPAMKKAIAIITDEGGLTCHAAIVARELNIPCVIGTKVATKIFKDGDKVEVDATNGIIKKI